MERRMFSLSKNKISRFVKENDDRSRNTGKLSNFDKERDDFISMSIFVKEKLNNVLQKLEEAETFMSATKEYVKRSRRMIANLRHCLTFLEVDVMTAEEAILESEKMISCLKSEIKFDLQSIHRRQPVGSENCIFDGTRGNSSVRSEADQLKRNASSLSLPIMAYENPSPRKFNENSKYYNHCEAVSRRKSATDSPIAKPGSCYRTFTQDSKNRVNKNPSVSDSRDTENLVKDYSGADRYNYGEETFKNFSCGRDPLSLRKVRRSTRSSDSDSNKACDEYSGSELDFILKRREYFSKLLQQNIKQNYSGISTAKVDDLSLRGHKKHDMQSKLFNNTDVDIGSDKEFVDSSENEEYSSGHESYLHRNKIQNTSTKSDEYDIDTPFSKAIKNILSRDSFFLDLGSAESNPVSQGSSDDKHQYKKSSPTGSRIEMSTPQKGTKKNEVSKTWLDTEESLENVLLELFTNTCNIMEDNQCNTKKYTDETVRTSIVSSHLNSEIGQYSTEGIDSLDASSQGEWNGKTLIVNSNQSNFEKMKRKQNLNKSMNESQGNITSGIEKEETTQYISMNSSFSSNKSAYFSFMRDTNADDFVEEKSITANASVNNHLDPPSEETTDTSVHDSSDDQQDKSSTSSSENFHASICSDSSGMSLTDVSPNTSIFENSNSFQFHSPSLLEDDSYIKTYPSRLLMSKSISGLYESDFSHGSFKGGLYSSPLNADSNEKSANRSSLEGKGTLRSRKKLFTTEANGSMERDYALEYNSHRKEPALFEIRSSEVSNNTDNTVKAVPFEAAFKKSKSLEILTCNPNKLSKPLSLITSENSRAREAEMKRFCFRRVEFFENVRNIKVHIYSKNIRTFIGENHWIQ